MKIIMLFIVYAEWEYAQECKANNCAFLPSSLLLALHPEKSEKNLRIIRRSKEIRNTGTSFCKLTMPFSDSISDTWKDSWKSLVSVISDLVEQKVMFHCFLIHWDNGHSFLFGSHFVLEHSQNWTVIHLGWNTLTFLTY